MSDLETVVNAHKFKPGDTARLVDVIVEPACGDHPAFLMGRKGERVKIIEARTYPGKLPYLVEGPTNKGKPWWAGDCDLVPDTH